MINSKASSVLYVAPADSMTIGSQAGVNFVLTPSIDKSLHCKITDIETCLDTFGDPVIRANILYSQDIGVPILKLRLRQPSGEIGFDSINISSRILASVLKEASLVTDHSQPKLFLAEDWCSMECRPEQFFMQKGSFPMMVTYHEPSPSLWLFLEERRFSDTDAAEMLRVLLESVHLCGAVMVWSWAYGLNPVLLSTNPEIFLSLLGDSFRAEGVDLKMVDTEKLLPEW